MLIHRGAPRARNVLRDEEEEKNLDLNCDQYEAEWFPPPAAASDRLVMNSFAAI